MHHQHQMMTLYRPQLDKDAGCEMGFLVSDVLAVIAYLGPNKTFDYVMDVLLQQSDGGAVSGCDDGEFMNIPLKIRDVLYQMNYLTFILYFQRKRSSYTTPRRDIYTLGCRNDDPDNHSIDCSPKKPLVKNDDGVWMTSPEYSIYSPKKKKIIFFSYYYYYYLYVLKTK
jgi:hypothetical protein